MSRISTLQTKLLKIIGVIVNAEDLADVLSFRKEKSKEANKLADYGLWEDAESTNLLIIEKMSGDSNAYMRLGFQILQYRKT